MFTLHNIKTEPKNKHCTAASFKLLLKTGIAICNQLHDTSSNVSDLKSIIYNRGSNLLDTLSLIKHVTKIM